MNGLAKITFDGREVVLKFGLPAIRRIMEKMLVYKLSDMDGEREIYNDLGLSHILYAGYLNGCMMRDELPSIPFETFYTLLEDSIDNKDLEAQVIAAIASFEASKLVKQSIENVKEEVEKKSLLNGTKLNHSPMENLPSSNPNSVE